MNDLAVVAIFLTVYAGMFLGRLPRLQLDRTGVALLGAIALLAIGAVTPKRALAAVDMPTIAILFAFMVIAAQLRLGGFFGWLTRRLAGLPVGPATLLAGLIAVVAALSAVFSNDVVCLAVAPVLIEVCRERRLAPVPYLLALACAANIGSAATLIGNPQNILVGQYLQLDFGGYLAIAAGPAIAGLAITWAVIAWRKGRSGLALLPQLVPEPAGLAPLPQGETMTHRDDRQQQPVGGAQAPILDRWQTFKGLAVAAALLLAFLLTDWPRDVAALAGAGVLLTSRRLHSRSMLGQVDWQLLVLFVGLFVVNDALQATALPAGILGRLAGAGIDPAQPGWLFGITVVLSNLVSNVPAMMLLLPVATHPLAGPVLALASTLAGNLLIVGSIANLIVVGAARHAGIRIGWLEHARVGVPVALLSLAVTAVLLLA